MFGYIYSFPGKYFPHHSRQFSHCATARWSLPTLNKLWSFSTLLPQGLQLRYGASFCSIWNILQEERWILWKKCSAAFLSILNSMERWNNMRDQGGNQCVRASRFQLKPKLNKVYKLLLAVTLIFRPSLLKLKLTALRHCAKQCLNFLPTKFPGRVHISCWTELRIVQTIDKRIV